MGANQMEKGPWAIYDALIEAIPQDIAVIDYTLGTRWSCVVAECGSGVCYTCSGGAPYRPRDMRGTSLREMAGLAKSWSFEEATLGIAALNAYYAQSGMPLMAHADFEEVRTEETDASNDRAEELRAANADADDVLIANNRAVNAQDDCKSRSNRAERKDAFALVRPSIEAMGGKAKVVVIGHFPNVGSLATCSDLVVLERNCRSALDTPDPACEYVLPQADFLFTTGVTLINKTAPRILALSRNAYSTMVGPSAIPAQPLFDAGLDNVSSRMVVDPEKAMFAARTGNRFGDSLRMFSLSNPDCG